MAFPAPDNDTPSSRLHDLSTSIPRNNLSTSNPQDNLSTSNPQDNVSTSTQHIKTAEDLLAWSIAQQHAPGPLHREKIERTPGDGRKSHGGPIRITRTSDGVLSEYGEKLERERLARSAAANQG
jgi:hypothetical protein